MAVADQALAAYLTKDMIEQHKKQEERKSKAKTRTNKQTTTISAHHPTNVWRLVDI
jgi:hypothetical protein